MRFSCLAVLVTSTLAAQGPIAWYSFDSQGNVGLDTAGGYNGSPVNVTQVPGLKGLAASFQNGYISLPTTPAFQLLSGDFTLGVFVKGNPGSGNRNWFAKGISLGGNLGDHQYGLGGASITGLSFNGGSGGHTESTTNVFDGKWHHVAGIKRGTTAELWIDGKREGAATITSNRDGGSFAIGRMGAACCESFNGQMDEAKIWNRALTGSEIAAEANALAAPSGLPSADVVFDDFHDLSNWRVTGRGLAGGCKMQAFGEQHVNALCEQFVRLDAFSRQVILQGQVVANNRQGAEISWAGPVALPAGGTFAARVRFRGVDDGPQGQASLKTFFTYFEAGCAHMEHDFELLTGTSATYADLWNYPNASDDTNPFMTTTTHFRNPDASCGSVKSSQSAQLDDGSVASRALRNWRLYSVDGNDFVEVTLVVTVQSVAVRRDGRVLYYCEYWATNDGNDAVWLGETLTWHDQSITTLTPIFNLWWLDPKYSSKGISVFSDAAAQYLDVLWFYWSRNILGYWQAHSIAQNCKDASSKSCPAQ